VEAVTDDDILEAVRFARTRAVPYFLLGGGSNLLVSDDGFAGIVVRIASRALAMHPDADSASISIQADAGVEWDAVVHAAVEHNAAGIECLAGIPGSVGGTPVQNVGAYGQEVASTISQVYAIDLEAERCITFSKSECGFAYRRSIFNTTHRGRYAITRVGYTLTRDDPAHLAYRDIRNYFAERAIAHPTLFETADAVREIRARKGMLLSAADPDSRSAGSFFKNPIVPAATVPGLAAIAGCHPDSVPQFPAEVPDRTKLSAAWLIELAGFHKGFTLGHAGLSTKHVLAIVNRGDATASEIVALRDLIVERVHARAGIRLDQEPVALGFSH
jgi:UDP-N-acetylmuramate dehydrogenase